MKKQNYFDLGYVRTSAVSPKLFLAKPMKNAEKIIEIAKQENEKESLIVLFPELGITGYTCEDLFHTQDLLNETKNAIKFVLTESITIDSILIIGHPYQNYDGRLYNCASIIHRGKLLAMIPKTHLPNQQEFYERRFFVSGLDVDLEINDFGQTFRLCSKQVVNYKNQVILGVEICEDSWAPLNPGTELVLNGGCNLLTNLSASNDLVGKHEYRKNLVTQHSARLNAGYLYVSSGAWESSKDIVFSGAALAAQNGTIIAEGERFSLEDQVTVAEFDVQKLALERRRNTTYGSSQHLGKVHVINLDDKFEYQLSSIITTYPKSPFISSNPTTLVERSAEILQIQSTGLARRMLSIGKPKLVLGLSGGLDSTLAMLVCLEAVKKVNQPISDIICISMPSFGTTHRTKDQAQRLALSAGVTFEEIDITNTVKSHFKDIGHDENNYNVVFENSQARERTQLLFDKSNAVSGMVVGTGDWSEQGLSFMTYGGDHLSNYNVNSSIPKTLVQHLIKYYKDYKTMDKEFIKVLQDVLETKISPELLPPDKAGNISQKTEEIVGPYSLTDFFLFHYVRSGFALDKILTIAQNTFKDEYSPEVVKKWMDICFDRFKKGQFKRTVSPPGPQVGSVSFSSRGSWRMPDENF